MAEWAERAMRAVLWAGMAGMVASLSLERALTPKGNGGKFWQITDIHWDQQYSESGDPSKMCHDEYQVSDYHNGAYGNYLCDSPWKLVKSSLQAMTRIHPLPEFVLWTGDNVPHTNDPEPDFSVIFRTVSNITNELRTAFPENIPILPVLGNHDAFPKDDFPVAGESFYGQYLTRGGWAAVLPQEAQEDFKKGGYYEYILPSGVTVLVVNTNLYYANNQLGTKAIDPCGQFAWLEEKLEGAQDRSSKVIIAAHAPPGYFERFAVIPFFNATYNSDYINLLNKHGKVIMAQIYGHEHTDSFRIFASDSGELQSVAFLAPSVTPWYPKPVPGGTAINPSLRLYTHDTSDILDYTQYHLNLGDLNDIPKEENGSTVASKMPEWSVFYHARASYGLEKLDVTNMAGLYKELSTNDSLFQQYYLRNSAGYNNGVCDIDCKRNHLCAIGHIKIEDLNSCMGFNDTTPGPDTYESTTSLYPEPVQSFILEDGSPVSADNFDDNSDGTSHLVIIMVALGMTLMVVLAVTLAAMLVIITLQRKSVLRREGSVPVSELSWGLRQQGYKPF